MPMSLQNTARLQQSLKRRLRNNRLDQRRDQLLQYPPCPGPGQAAQAVGGVSSSASTSGSSNKIINKCARIQGRADRSSTPGGFLRPMRLFNRLNPSSIRHRRRYSASTSSVENVSSANDVTRISQSAASSVACDGV